MDEYIDILNGEMQPIGVATREEIHRQGYWHQTFHCWVILLEGDRPYILFQKRHPSKETFPNKLDISAAGHMLEGETVADGVRELHEELGIHVNYSELIPLGIYKGSYITEAYKDREFNHIHLLKANLKLDDFSIQQSELKGLYKIDEASFRALLQGKQQTVEAIGFEFDSSGQKEQKYLLVGRGDFAAQGEEYYNFVFRAISRYRNGNLSDSQPKSELS
jgi:isopentenyldiphosphate isomerase